MMTESGSNSEHGASHFTAAAWTWAGEDRGQAISPIEFQANIQVVQARGSAGRVSALPAQPNKRQAAAAAVAGLKETSPDARKRGARAIEEAAEWLAENSLLTGAVEALLDALLDSDWTVRAQVAQALGATGSRLPEGDLKTQVQDRLTAALLDEQGLIRAVAARSLDRFNWQPGKDQIAASYWAIKRVWQMCVAIGEPAIEPLNLALTDWDWTVRRGAAEALGRIGPKAMQPLIEALSDDIPVVCEAAAVALGRIGALQAVPAIIERLESLGEAGVRAIAQIAGKTEQAQVSASILHPLSACLRADDPYLRAEAAVALGRVGGSREEKEIHAQIARLLSAVLQDPEWTVRCEALRGIAAIGMKTNVDDLRWGAAAALLAGARDPMDEVQKAALTGLGSVGARIESPALRRMLVQEIGEALPDPDDAMWELVSDLMAVPDQAG